MTGTGLTWTELNKPNDHNFVSKEFIIVIIIIIIIIVDVVVVIIIIIIIIIIKRDFLKHKTVKANDKNRRFGVFMTPLSRKI